MKTISIIVPCYNEEQVINLYYKECIKCIDEIDGYGFEFVFVNDGSSDLTLQMIKQLGDIDTRVKYISFSRNFGKEAGILAGLKNCKGDLVVVMDADLQHPPTLLRRMIEHIEDGYDSVSTRRVARNGESKFRGYFSKKFYKMLNIISDVKIIEGATDYRMMTRQMVESVLEIVEYHRFSKGIFEWVGYDTKWIEYESEDRIAGESKWSFWHLFKYAIEGIVSFSTKPLKIATVTGVGISSMSFAYFVYILLRTLIQGKDIPGYASTICIITFLGGMQLIATGILGEYIARTYMEAKSRPNYFIKDSNLVSKKNK
ncbi:MAG: glycosyltransferase family 2 protein [Clostridium sp.]|uniref:glycosyltransferase family 2 protein n=1 Tax=Clostridium sp. TaxID=1506 RepID=UPI00304A90D5